MWFYFNEELSEIPEGVIGFVYLISGPTKKYVGKKAFYFSKFKRVKGRKKRVKVPSDWQKYWSSSAAVKADVIKFGEDAFKREILYLCENKAQLSYMELMEQINRGVLISDEYYNEWISVKIRKSRNLIVPSQQT